MAILITSAVAFEGQDKVVHGASDLAEQLSPLLGTWPTLFIAFGFLAAGLIWSFFITNEIWKTNVSLFFLICVTIAGIYGGLTATKKIFFIQALPAIFAIALLLFRM